MDTDGYAGESPEFCSTSLNMAESVRRIVESLGGTASIGTKKSPTFTYKNEKRHGRTAYRVVFTLPPQFNPFRLTRKAVAYKPASRGLGRWIDAIDPAEPGESICIKVATEDGLFVIDRYVVTHNTPMQLDWARHVCRRTGGDVLILAPLAVSQQTVHEGEKFGIPVRYARDKAEVQPGITITNYERLDNFDPKRFAGVVLDESGILKSYTGKYKRQIIRWFKDTPYKLACTATPAPNDHMELLNHAAFLGVMESHEALSIWFINDSMTAGSYRLKKHGENDFWRWVCSWAVSISMPSDLGYPDGDFLLPPLQIHERIIDVDLSQRTEGLLFRMPNMSATEYFKEKKLTAAARVEEAAQIVNGCGESYCVWCETNHEANLLRSAIPDCTEIRGCERLEMKEQAAEDFVSGKIRTMVSKPSIFGHGLNFQHCHNVIFCGLSYSFENYYQAVRRFWRFGQKHPVNVYIILGQTEKQILATIHEKEQRYREMKESILQHVRKFQNLKTEKKFKMDYTRQAHQDDQVQLILGDCVEEIKAVPDRSIGFSIFSPPFSNLYVYSDNLRDMGNCKDDGHFMENFGFLVPELHRITMNGRLCAVHCKDLVKYKNRDTVAGLKDFPGEIVRLFESHGWQYHSKVTIWKDPVIEMQRTKSHGLLYKQLCKDSTYSRQGCPDYLAIFRKWAEEDDCPVTAGGERFDRYIGETAEVHRGLAMAGGPGGKAEATGKEYDRRGYSIHVWQRYASPVWFDIRQTDVLNVQVARDDKDERHICPLQLGVIRRAVHLWTNPDDTVFSPFMGIGSEGYVAVEMGRKFVGIELKEAYYQQAVKNIKEAQAKAQQGTLFAQPA
jgi:superfamily II DNA or RNA helicase